MYQKKINVSTCNANILRPYYNVKSLTLNNKLV